MLIAESIVFSYKQKLIQTKGKVIGNVRQKRPTFYLFA